MMMIITIMKALIMKGRTMMSKTLALFPKLLYQGNFTFWQCFGNLFSAFSQFDSSQHVFIVKFVVEYFSNFSFHCAA